MNEEPAFPSKKSKIFGAVIAVAAVIGVVGWFVNRPDTDDAPIMATTTQPTQTPSMPAPAKTTETKTVAQTEPTPSAITLYKDGTYKATGSYVSPAGKETVDISLTLANGIITDASFTGNATNPGSKMWQGNFSKGYQSLVVGKSIDELALTVVNGSSLTPKGFMDAVAQAKREAKS